VLDDGIEIDLNAPGIFDEDEEENSAESEDAKGSRTSPSN